MATGNSFPPVPTQTPLIDKNSASGISWGWLQWFIAVANFFSRAAATLVASFNGRSGAVLPQAGDYPPNLGGTGQTNWQKGNLLTASAPNVTALLPVGPNTSLLTADSGSPDGVKWALPASAAVSSVFGRTGAVAAVAGDYSPANGGTGQTAWTKGNLLVGQAVGVTALLATGANASFLVADSSAINGVRWGTFQDAVVPAGLINGVNTVYTLPLAPNPAASLELFENIGGVGQYNLQIQGVNYTLAGNTITYTVAPIAGTLHITWSRT